MAYVEEEIDSRLPYRIGCPKLPVLPVETRIRHSNFNKYFPHAVNHLTKVRGILEKYDIPEFGLVCAHRVNRGTDVADHDPTLVLVSTYEDGCQDRWVQAVREIRKGFVDAGIHCAVELIDQRVYDRPLCNWPVLSTDGDLIQGWGKVFPSVLTTIEDRNWVAIDVLYREFPSRENQPTVIISAQDANDDAWWDNTLPALHQLLQANDMKVDIVLLFLKGTDLMMTDSNTPEGRFETDHTFLEDWAEPDPLIREDFYEETIYMGTSLATPGSRATGTLGGRIKLQSGSSILELGLTNYHTLSDALPDQGSLGGPFSPDPEQPYGTVVSPSDRDHKAAVQCLVEASQNIDERHKDLSQKLECLLEDDPSWERNNRATKIAYHEKCTSELKLERAENVSRHVGRVFAASGFRTCENPRYIELMQHQHWALDWCLVQVNQPSSFSCQLKEVRSSVAHIRRGQEVTQYCSISASENYKVIKRGRTTGWTRGTVSAIDSTIRIQDRSRPDTRVPTNQKVTLGGKWDGKPVFVHAIAGTTTHPQFLQPGDSGSLMLLDPDSNIPGLCIVGLGFAANAASHASYMSPMDLVVKDIEDVTGTKIIEPQYAGTASPVNDEQTSGIVTWQLDFTN